MIIEQHLSRISALTRRNTNRKLSQLPAAEDLCRQLAIVMVGLVLFVGCIRGAASVFINKPAAVKVTVKPGDTLWKYASAYGDQDRYILSRVEDIVKANNLPSKSIQPGMELVIPR